jgi:hypothetical protein
VQSGSQRIRLVTRLAVQSNDAAIGQSAVCAESRELLGDHADAVIGDDDYAAQPQYLAIPQCQ